MTNVNGDVVDCKNIDTVHGLYPHRVVKDKLAEFKKIHLPIVVDYGTGTQLIYYGESELLTQLRYFPYVQLGIIMLFLIVGAHSADHSTPQPAKPGMGWPLQRNRPPTGYPT